MTNEPKAPAKRTPGNRAGLNRERVLDTALALADRDGVRALTMRRLGDELGVEAMTLYHYVANKDALLDGLVERVFARAMAHAEQQAARAADAEHVDAWRELLAAYASALRTALLRHPGVLSLATTRPAVTPATLDVVESTLGALTSAGFPLARAVDALNALTVFVIGHASAEAAIAPAPDSPGSAAWLADLDPARYPLLTEAAREGAGTDDEQRFTFAVDALLTGYTTAKA